MTYHTLKECLIDLEKNGQLIRIKEEVDTNLEMAAIHLRVYAQKGPALLFENVIHSKYQAASNIFGTLDRSKFIFRNTLNPIKKIIELKSFPNKIFQKPLNNLSLVKHAFNAMPLKSRLNKLNFFDEINISDLPLIKHWPQDGGAFITLPQVYTEDIEKPGIMHSNLGMYRIQLNGNEYKTNKEVGLHYQLHRGIGIHQTKSNRHNKPLKVSIFVGGPPAHTVAAVMPLPEGMSELTFAGLLAGRRFRYCYQDGYCISNDADFVITGELSPNENKPEGPFGDHLGYYSLMHPFPLLKVHKVYARKNAIWPFTVVGRPPQEDTSFGQLIHEISGTALKVEIPGLKEVYAVDDAGVHPLLLAIGSERYTPYAQTLQPSEILTIANRILGTGQLSLAKFLFITAENDNNISTHHVEQYFSYILERVDWRRDVHFYTHTTIDTLDYSGTTLNYGSKVVIAAYGEQLRTLCSKLPNELFNIPQIISVSLVHNGIVAIQIAKFESYEKSQIEIKTLAHNLSQINHLLKGVALIVICDNSVFLSQNFSNFLWVTFTRSNPSHDIFGIDEFTENKHWGCNGSLIIDARVKTHHAPTLELDVNTERKIDKLWEKGGSLYNVR